MKLIQHFSIIVFIAMTPLLRAQSYNFDVSKYITVSFPLEPQLVEDDGLNMFYHKSENGMMSVTVTPPTPFSVHNQVELEKVYSGNLAAIRKKGVLLEKKEVELEKCKALYALYQIEYPNNLNLFAESYALYFRKNLYTFTYMTPNLSNPLAQAEKNDFFESLVVHNQNGTISQLDTAPENSLIQESNSGSWFVIGEIIGVLLVILIVGVLLYSYRDKIF